MQIVEDDGTNDIKLRRLKEVPEKVKRIAINSLILMEANTDGDT